MGRDLVQMGEATQMVTGAGADIVDLNLGCPSPAVVRKGVGSAMLKDLGLLREVVRAMRERTHLPLSAKMRAGFDDQMRAVDIARTLEDAGIDFITVHPRKRSDFYRGRADWSIITAIAASVTVPVVANGDIWTTTDAARVAEETRCAALMLGRRMLRNPWLASDLASLARGEELPKRTTLDLLQAFQSLTAVLTETVPPHALTGVLKEHLRYLLELDPGALGYARVLFRETETIRLAQGLEAALSHARPLRLGAVRGGGLFEQRNELEGPALPTAHGGCSSAAPT